MDDDPICDTLYCSDPMSNTCYAQPGKINHLLLLNNSNFSLSK